MNNFTCDKCNGDGYVYTYQGGDYKIKTICDKCWGEKFLDWIENILGKKVEHGTNNILIGQYAGYSLALGRGNIIIGFKAGYYLTHGSNNIIIGNYAGQDLTVESNRIVIGNEPSFDLFNEEEAKEALSGYPIGPLLLGM